MFGKHANTNALRLPTGLPSVLACVVDRDSDVDNRTCAMNCLANIATKSNGRSLLLADNEIVACALRVVQEQGTGAAPLRPALTPPPPPPTHTRARSLARLLAR